MKKEDTKQIILEKALELFRKKDTIRSAWEKLQKRSG